MEIICNISIGENLKNIRTELGLKQYEISRGKITRNLISLIENDKTPLTKDNAVLISENINKIMKEKNLDVYIDPMDILEPIRYKAKKKANIIIETLEKNLKEKNLNITIEELEKFESFLNKWNIDDKKVKIYSLIGDIYYYKRNFDMEYIYYTKALECSYNFTTFKDRHKLILILVANRINGGKYEEAIQLSDIALLNKKYIPDRSIGLLHYNKALIYNYLSDFNKSLKELENAKPYFNNKDDEFKDILILEANSNANKKNFEKALKIYKKVLQLLEAENNYNKLCITNINIIQMHIHNNDKEEVIKYLNIIINLISKLGKDSPYLAEIYYEIANIYYYLDQYELTEVFLKNAFLLAKQNRGEKTYTAILSELVSLYYEKNQHDKINKLFNIFKKEAFNTTINNNNVIFLTLLKHCINQSRNKEAKKLIDEFNSKKKGG